MNINKGIFRIYLVLSIIWFIFWILPVALGDGNFGSQAGQTALLTAIIPLPLYFILKWILKGFK